MSRTTKSEADMAARRRAAESGKPAIDRPGADENQLEKRIERLEEKMAESVLGNDGLAMARTDHGLEGSETENALKRAVTRSNIRRGSRKA